MKVKVVGQSSRSQDGKCPFSGKGCTRLKSGLEFKTGKK